MVCEKRTITIRRLQSLTGTLNFLCKAIIPGRVFTKLMYNKLKLVDKLGNKLKQYHHVTLDHQFKEFVEFGNSSCTMPTIHQYPDHSLTSTLYRIQRYWTSIQILVGIQIWVLVVYLGLTTLGTSGSLNSSENTNQASNT